MLEVGKIIPRSRRAVLESLKIALGGYCLEEMTRPTLIEYGKKRAKKGAGPATLAVDFSFIGTLMTRAASAHGISVFSEQVKLARVALIRLGLIGNASEQDRRPTQRELDDLIKHFDEKPLQLIPMSRIIRFKVATALCQEEICKIIWDDVNIENRIVAIRDRKIHAKKDGSHMRVPMLDLTGYGAWDLLLEQHIVTRGKGRMFPHHHKSTGTAFQRACKDLKINNLQFHDLRHDATSRLFETGLTIEKVALVKGHKDWKMSRRFANLKPGSLHRRTQNQKFGRESMTHSPPQSYWACCQRLPRHKTDRALLSSRTRLISLD